MVRNFRVP